MTEISHPSHEQEARKEELQNAVSERGIRLVAGTEYLDDTQPVDPPSLEISLRKIADGGAVDPKLTNAISRVSTNERANEERYKGKSFEVSYAEWQTGMTNWIQGVKELKTTNSEMYYDNLFFLINSGIKIDSFNSEPEETRNQLLGKLYNRYFNKDGTGETDVDAIKKDIFSTSKNSMAAGSDPVNAISVPRLPRKLRSLDSFLASCGEKARVAIHDQVLTEGYLRGTDNDKNLFIETAIDSKKVIQHGTHADPVLEAVLRAHNKLTENEVPDSQGTQQEETPVAESQTKPLPVPTDVFKPQERTQSPAEPSGADQEDKVGKAEEADGERVKFAEALESGELREGGVYDLDGEALYAILPRLYGGGETIDQVGWENPIGYDKVTIVENKILCEMSLGFRDRGKLEATYGEELSMMDGIVEDKTIVLLSSSRKVNDKDLQQEVEGFDQGLRDRINNRLTDLEVDEMSLAGDKLIVKLKKAEKPKYDPWAHPWGDIPEPIKSDTDQIVEADKAPSAPTGEEQKGSTALVAEAESIIADKSLEKYENFSSEHVDMLIRLDIFRREAEQSNTAVPEQIIQAYNILWSSRLSAIVSMKSDSPIVHDQLTAYLAKRREESLAVPVEAQKAEGRLEPDGYSEGQGTQNEDYIFFDDESRVLVVLDGMGRHSAGEVASRTAGELITKKLKDFPNELSPSFSLQDAEEQMKKILLEANDELVRIAGDNPAYKGMGTTASVVKILNDGTAIIGNVGDSRVYLLRKDSNSPIQLTLDDSSSLPTKHDEPTAWEVQKRIGNARMPEELPTLESLLIFHNHSQLGDMNAKITQALGREEGITPHIYSVQLARGDKLFLTSDGIHDNLTDSEIAGLINDNQDNLHKAAVAVVEKAHEIGQLEDEKDDNKKLIYPRAKRDDRSMVVASWS